MAARRLLIVMLILLGISTLAAALVPQRTLREGTNTAGTTTGSVPTAPAPPPSAVPPVAEISAGGRKFPVVPVQVGEQFTLLVLSRRPQEIAIPEFGQLGFATADTPARFELLPNTPGTVGILYANTGKVVGQIQVVGPSAKKKGAKKKEKRKGGAKSRARAGSGSG
jgi:hypothetical protein